MAENDNNKLENGTVRDKIILFLRDGKPKHFTDITKGLNKHDFTINRVLKILIDSNWILKTGKKPKTLYSLDLTRDDVNKYLKHYDVAIPSNNQIDEIKFEFCYEKLVDWIECHVSAHDELFQILPDLSEEKHAKIMELINRDRKHRGEHRKLMKELAVDIFNNINVYAITEKNDMSISLIQDPISKKQYENMVFLIKNILDNQRRTFLELLRKENSELYRKTSVHEITQQIYDKPFKLVITYNPKKD